MSFDFDTRQAQSRLNDHGYRLTVDGQFGPRSWAALLGYIGGRRLGAMQQALGEQAALLFPKFDITTPMRIAHNLAQSSVETNGFTRLVENLNYSATRICQVWPSRFSSIASALPYANNPEGLANKVYGGRFGNDQPGDGWKYRGRGTKQTTFRDNYAEVDAVTGLNVLADPDQLADPAKGSLAGCIYWAERGCNAIADRDDVLAITRRVNGGTNGLPDRRTALTRAKRILI